MAHSVLHVVVAAALVIATSGCSPQPWSQLIYPVDPNLQANFPGQPNANFTHIVVLDAHTPSGVYADGVSVGTINLEENGNNYTRTSTHYVGFWESDTDTVSLLGGLLNIVWNKTLYQRSISLGTYEYSSNKVLSMSISGKLFRMQVGKQITINFSSEHGEEDLNNSLHPTNIVETDIFKVIGEKNGISLNGLTVQGPVFDVEEEAESGVNIYKSEYLWSQLMGYPVYSVAFDSQGNVSDKWQILQASGVTSTAIDGSLASVMPTGPDNSPTDDELAQILSDNANRSDIAQFEGNAQGSANEAELFGALGAIAAGANPATVEMNAGLLNLQQATTGQGPSTDSAAVLMQKYSGPLGSSIGLNLSTPPNTVSTSSVVQSGYGGQTWASMSQAQQKALASQLQARAQQECGHYTSDQLAPNQLPEYEAAACTEAVFAEGVPTDYPGLQSIKASAMQNYRQAKELGSSMPVPTFAP